MFVQAGSFDCGVRRSIDGLTKSLLLITCEERNGHRQRGNSCPISRWIYVLEIFKLGILKRVSCDAVERPNGVAHEELEGVRPKVLWCWRLIWVLGNVRLVYVLKVVFNQRPEVSMSFVLWPDLKCLKPQGAPIFFFIIRIVA